MSPTIVHRYAFPAREAIEALLGDAVGDCEAWLIRVEGDDLVIDVVGPAEADDIEQPTGQKPGGAAQAQAGEKPDFPADEQSGETSPDPIPEPDLKGGPLARKASMTCGEKGFWKFLGVGGADEAKAEIYRRCGVSSRKMLDHDDAAAAIWREIDRKYGLWLEGFDVELD